MPKGCGLAKDNTAYLSRSYSVYASNRLDQLEIAQDEMTVQEAYSHFTDKVFTIVDLVGFTDPKITMADYYRKKDALYNSGALANQNTTLTANHLPKYLNIRSKNSLCCGVFNNSRDFKFEIGVKGDHTHVLGVLLPYSTFCSDTKINILGCMTPGMILPLDEHTSVFYIDVGRYVPMKTSYATNYILSSMYNDLCVDLVLPVTPFALCRKREEGAAMYNPLAQPEKFKEWTQEEVISIVKGAAVPSFYADYQELIVAEDLSRFLKRPEVMVKLNTIDLRGLAGIGRFGLLGCILWSTMADNECFAIAHNYGLFSVTSFKDFIGLGKELSEIGKHLQHICNLDLRALFEIHTLVNRVDTPIDWLSERDHRIRPNIAVVNQAKLYDDLVAMFAQKQMFARKHYATCSWEDFWQRRYEWAPVGATFSQYEEDRQYLDKRQMYKNKLMQLVAMPDKLSFDYFYGRQPETVAKTQVKYEWTKQRAIYSCDLTNFVMAQFALGNCENYFDDRFPVGLNSRPERVNGMIRSVLHNTVPLCLDYEDFNSQHSTESMLTVLRAFYAVYQGQMSEQQKLAMGWFFEATKHQSVVDDIGGTGKYETKGTLFSGWRLTSFMNTALNYGYFQQLGSEVRHDAHVHSGDDTLAGITRTLDIQTIYRSCEIMNIRLSKGKSHFSSLAEFLRVDHKGDQYGQYLARGIASFIYSKTESDPAFDYKDVVEAYKTRSGSIISRGANIDLVADITVRALMRHSEVMTGKRICPGVLMSVSTTCGGLSNHHVSRYDKLITKRRLELGLVNLALKTEKNIETEIILPEHELHGANDYANWLADRFPDYTVHRRRIAENLKSTLIATFAQVRAKFDITDLDAKQEMQYKRYRALKGAHTSVLRYVQYGRAKAVGLLTEVLRNTLVAQTLWSVVSCCDNPISVLSLLL